MTQKSTAALTLSIKEITPYMRQMRTRMPFRFGKTVMTGMPVLHLRVRMEDSTGKSFEGWAACGLVSMWFDKDYTKSEAQREADLMRSTGVAASAYEAAGSGTSFELHQRAEADARRTLEAEGMTGLVAGYGVALVDSAVIDGVCRYAGMSFFDGLRAGILGFDARLRDCLPDVPSAEIALRHTIGLGDPLTSADGAEPINDGLPQTLEEVCRQYGARYFKIKVNNDVEASIDRLMAIDGVLRSHGGDYRATLDGNEAFPTMQEFLEFAKRCAATPEIADLWKRALWIEQPVARQQALEPEVERWLTEVRKIKPVIIDESDDADDALERALRLGYSGISAKNCKGVYRTLASYVAINTREDRSGLVLSSEDLTNQPILPNHQDLCVAAALGIIHSERNGHHFYRSFDFLSDEERRQAMADYPDLYELTADGIPSLRFQNGYMSMHNINVSPGLGVKRAPDWAALEAVQLPGQQ